MSYLNIKKFIKEHNLNNEDLSWDELKELYFLISEVEELGFTCSSELSRYIRENRLGYKYRHISGIVTMENNRNTWQFKGGFPPNIYRIVCNILDLGNRGSYARVVGYQSYSRRAAY